MSLGRTSLSGFSLGGRGGTLWGPSNATDFRFLDTFIAGGGETPWERVGDGKEWNGRADHLLGRSARGGRAGFRPWSVAHLIGPARAQATDCSDAGGPSETAAGDPRGIALHYHSLRTQLPISYPTPDSSRAFRLVRGRRRGARSTHREVHTRTHCGSELRESS